VPRSARATTAAAVRDAAAMIGFPVIVKPIDGAGTADTHLVADAAALEHCLARVAHVPHLIVEEFIVGEELTYDAVSIAGVPAFDSVAHYHPKPLESRTQEWISPAQIVYRDPHAQPELAPGIALGRQVLTALGMQTGFTHMEWFRTPRGEAVFGEIAARAPGAKDAHQGTGADALAGSGGGAQGALHGGSNGCAHRHYNVGVVFKRALGAGHISRVEGHAQVRAAFGPFIVEDALLPIGAARRDWKNTLLSDGWIAVRHPGLGACRGMMQAIVEDVRLFAR